MAKRVVKRTVPQLIGEIQEAAVSRKHTDVFVSWYGHVNALDVKITVGGRWESGSELESHGVSCASWNEDRLPMLRELLKLVRSLP